MRTAKPTPGLNRRLDVTICSVGGVPGRIEYLLWLRGEPRTMIEYAPSPTYREGQSVCVVETSREGFPHRRIWELTGPTRPPARSEKNDDDD